MIKIKNKRGQAIGETMTWVVATVVIAVILMVSLFIVSAMSVANGNYLGFGSKVAVVHSSIDLFADMSLTSFLLTNESNGKVYQSLKSGSFNDFNGQMAKDIFMKLYGSPYFIFSTQVTGVSVGISSNPLYVKSNEYFKIPTVIGSSSTNYALNIGENKFVGLVLNTLY